MLVTVAVLASAVIHAIWNALAHRVPDPLAAITLIGLGLAGVSVPLLFVVPPPAVRSWPYLAASVAVHIGYCLLLARSYRLGDFGQVYPVARGTSPLVVALAAAVLLGERLSGPTLGGVLLVCLGLSVLTGLVGQFRVVGPRGAGRFAGVSNPRAIGAAALTGLSIATYTVLDGAGVRVAGGQLSYSVWLLSGLGLGLGAVSSVVYGRKLPSAFAGRWWLVPVGGVLCWASYTLVLWAQTRGALAAVAALRETSVIAAAVIGTLVFGERFGRQRILATVLVATGVLLINL